MRALDVLELDSDADFEAVKKSWRRLAKENHPDVKPGDANAAVRFQAIQAAYEVLKTAEERRAWRSEEHTSALQSLMRTSSAVLCLKKTTTTQHSPNSTIHLPIRL